LKKSLKLVAVAASLTLITGVAVAPTAQAAKIKLCLALDTGGVDDRSFNASAWAGAKASKVATAEYLPAASSADYAPNIKTFVDKGCELIIGVGYLTTSAIKDAAIANPKVKFAIIDDVIEGVSNAKSITFQTDEAAFMAGYLAAGMSKTKKVAAERWSS
jgi:basic membrane protein A